MFNITTPFSKIMRYKILTKQNYYILCKKQTKKHLKQTQVQLDFLICGIWVSPADIFLIWIPDIR